MHLRGPRTPVAILLIALLFLAAGAFYAPVVIVKDATNFNSATLPDEFGNLTYEVDVVGTWLVNWPSYLMLYSAGALGFMLVFRMTRAATRHWRQQ